MKKFKFEIELTEKDLEGDEFWEDAIEQDNTGIKALTQALVDTIIESNLLVSSPRVAEDIIRLIHYSDE